MSLRIHSASTLDEAATWLSEETTETWNVRAVLEGLLRGWRYRGVNAVRLLPISLEMVVPPGSIMRDSILTEQTHVTDRPQTLIAGGAALEKLLHDLLQYGEATDVPLNSNGGQRWLCTSPLRPEHVRLPAGVIDTLVPEFDRLVKSDLAAQLLASLAEDAPVAPAPPAVPASKAPETREQRQDRRLQACIDAGLPMDTKAALSRLPDGVGGVADREGVTRQAFSADIKAALKRRESSPRMMQAPAFSCI